VSGKNSDIKIANVLGGPMTQAKKGEKNVPQERKCFIYMVGVT